MIVRLTWDLILWCGLLLRPRQALEAEILFLRRQLVLYREREAKPRRMDAATRVMLALLSRCFDWRSALVVADGRRESCVGSRADRERTAAQARTSSVAADGGEVHAATGAGSAAGRSAMVNLPSQSRTRRHCL